MSLHWNSIWSAVVAVSAMLSVVATGRTLADEADATRYTVPAGGSGELLKFIEGLKNYRPKSSDDALAHGDKAQVAIKQAATRVRQLETDKSSTAYLHATAHLIGTSPPGQQDKLIAEIAQGLRTNEVTADDVDFALRIANSLENSGQRALAAKLYSAFGEAIAQSKDPRIARDGRQLAGAALRLNLVGKTLELQGTKMDGSAFDLTSLRGKVVLINFWEFNSEICRAELPYVKKLYDDFHARGFEIVCVCLDEDRAALQKTLAADKVP